MHFRVQLSDVEAQLVERDWVSALSPFGDEAIGAAANTWLMREDWMPTLAGFLGEVQDQARRLAKIDADKRGLPTGPRNDEPLADSHQWAETIRIATGLRVVDPDVKVRSNETRGHDHSRGAGHCRVCSGQRRIDEKTRTFEPPKPQWSSCSECDGSHFVWIEDDAVRPCSRCNGFAYSLWIGGHYEPGHRCDECAPVGRRRKKEDA